MTIFRSKTKIESIRESISAIIFQHGVDTLQQVIEEIGLVRPSNEIQTLLDPSLEEACMYFLSSPTYDNYSSASKTSYKSELQQYQNFVVHYCKDNHPTLKHASSPDTISRYLRKYEGSNTIVKKRAFLRSFLRVTLGHFYHQSIDDYKKLLPLKRIRDDDPKAFRKIQLAELLNLAQLSNDGHRNHTILWVFLGTGIRLSELCRLQIKDINALDRHVKVSSPKGNEGRKERRTISSLAILYLMDYIHFKYDQLRQTIPQTDYQDLYVFSKNFGKTHLSQRAIQYMVSKLIEQARSIDDKEKYSVHSFRHSFALYALESGVDIYLISRLLGHKSIGTTEEYLDLFDDQLRNAIDKNPIATEEMQKLQERMENLCQSYSWTLNTTPIG
jgi:integrase/recombinase XerD